MPTTTGSSHLEKGEGYDRNISSGGFDTYMADRKRENLSRVIPQLFPDRIPRFLDFACGTGRITQLMEQMAEQSFGVDVSESMVEQARRKCTRTTFIIRDLTRDESPVESVDLVSAFRFFGNAQDELRASALLAINRILVGGGYLILNNHRNPLSIRNLMLRPSGRMPLVDLSYGKLKKLLKDAGFRIVRGYGIGFWVIAYRHERPEILTSRVAPTSGEDLRISPPPGVLPRYVDRRPEGSRIKPCHPTRRYLTVMMQDHPRSTIPDPYEPAAIPDGVPRRVRHGRSALRILYTHRTRGVGAEGAHIMGMVEAFRESGHEVEVDCLPGCDPFVKNLAPPGGRRALGSARRPEGGPRPMAGGRLPPDRGPFPPVRVRGGGAALQRPAALAARSEAAATEPDFVYERYSLGNFAPALLCRMLRIPLVVEINDSVVIERSRPLSLPRVKRMLERRILSSADLVITVSRRFEAQILEAFPRLPRGQDPGPAQRGLGGSLPGHPRRGRGGPTRPIGPGPSDRAGERGPVPPMARTGPADRGHGGRGEGEGPGVPVHRRRAGEGRGHGGRSSGRGGGPGRLHRHGPARPRPRIPGPPGRRRHPLRRRARLSHEIDGIHGHGAARASRPTCRTSARCWKTAAPAGPSGPGTWPTCAAAWWRCWRIGRAPGRWDGAAASTCSPISPGPDTPARSWRPSAGADPAPDATHAHPHPHDPLPQRPTAPPRGLRARPHGAFHPQGRPPMDRGGARPLLPQAPLQDRRDLRRASPACPATRSPGDIPSTIRATWSPPRWGCASTGPG